MLFRSELNCNKVCIVKFKTEVNNEYVYRICELMETTEIIGNIVLLSTLLKSDYISNICNSYNFELTFYDNNINGKKETDLVYLDEKFENMLDMFNCSYVIDMKDKKLKIFSNDDINLSLMFNLLTDRKKVLVNCYIETL